MRRFLPGLLFLSALAGCGDLIAKLKGGNDAGADVTVPVPEATTAQPQATTPTNTPPPPPTTTAAPLGGGGAPTVKPVAKDGGTADAAAPVADAGAKPDAGPTPIPTIPPFPIPPGLLDGGLKFDAGGFKPPWMK